MKSFPPLLLALLTTSARAVEYAGIIDTALDPAGNVSINRDTVDAVNYLGNVGFQAELDPAVTGGFGGVMFTGAGSGETNLTALTGSYAPGKDLRIGFSRIAVANYGTIDQLSPNGDSIVVADSGSNSAPITYTFANLPPGEWLAKLGFTLINRTSGTVSPVAEATVHFADRTSLVLSDTIVTGDHNTDNTFFSIDGSARGGITSVTFINSNGGRGFGIDGVGFITEESGPIVTSPAAPVQVDGSSGTGFHTFTATDPDGGTVSYALIGGEDADDFVLSGPNNEILSYHPDAAATAAPFDLATPTDGGLDHVYEIAVRATSSASAETRVQTVTVTVIPPTPPVVTAGNITLSGSSGSNESFRVNDTVTVAWDSSPGGDNNRGLTGVTMDFSEFGGPAAAPATDLGGTWVADYLLPAGNLDINGANVSVTASNVIGPTTATGTDNALVDTEAPVVTDLHLGVVTTGSGAGGEFLSGDLITVRWTNTGGDGNIDFNDSVIFNLSAFGGGSSVEGTETPPGSGLWQATYSVNHASPEGTGLNASVTVTDNAGNSSSLTDTSNVAIVTPGTVVGSVTGVLDESDPGLLATYSVQLEAVPSGPVEITATADGDSEVSLDGASFSPAVSFLRTDTTPRTLWVRVLDDTLREGDHKTRLSHAVTATGDPATYPTNLPVNSAFVGIVDDEAPIGYHQLSLTDQGAFLQGTFSQAAAYADQTFIVVGYAAEDASTTSPVAAVEVIPPGGVATPLTNSVYTGRLDDRGHAGLWYEAFPTFAGGTYTVNLTTTTGASQGRAVVWVVNGAVGVRGAGYIACRDDENGGGGTGGVAGSIGFNFTGTRVPFSKFPASGAPLGAVQAGDFVLAIGMTGEEGDRVASPVGGWDTIDEDLDFSGGGYTTFQEAADTDAPALGVNLNGTYYRLLLAALALEFPPRIDATTDSDGDGLPDFYELANGLDPEDPADALTDPDGDGFHARGEFRHGTLENDRDSVFTFSVERLGAPGPAFELRFGPVFETRRYEVATSADAVIFSEVDSFEAPADAAERALADDVLLDAKFFRIDVAQP